MRNDRDYIEDVLDAIKKIERFIGVMSYEEFLQDDKTKFAVVRALEIIGEAVKRISNDIKRKHPEIPWKFMAGMRDKLIHAYFGVDWEVVWLTVRKDIPKIKLAFEELLAELEGDENV